jgi:hypothetical protein
VPDVRMPNGTIIRGVPDGVSRDDLLRRLQSSGYDTKALLGPPATPEAEVPTAPEQPKEELGFLGALKRGFTTLGDVPEALGFATGKEGAREELVRAQEGEEKRAEGFGLDKTLGENVQALKELAGESLGFMGAPLAAGAAGSLAGGPIGGGIAAAATLLSQYGVQNLARQAQEDEARVARGEAPLGAMPGRAAAAAVGQAGLDVAGFALPILRPVAAAFPFLRPLVGLGGKKAAAETAEAIVEAAAKKQLTIKGGIARGIVEGVAFEIPQEAAQTVLERWQAKLPLDDDSAIEEYKQAAIGAAVLGGGFGGTFGGLNAARERANTTKETKALEAAAGLELSTPEEKAEFARLLSPTVNEYANANPSVAAADILKALRDAGTLRSLGNRAKANVEATQTQAEAGAGLDGGAGRPDVDVAGASGTSVPDTVVTAPAEEAAEGLAPAEPIGVAGVGEPVGGVAGAETGADGALTEEVAPAAPVAAAPAERAKPIINEYIIDDAIDSEGPEQVRIVRRPDGAYIMRGEQLIDVSGQVEAGMADEQIIASRIGEDTSGTNVRPIGAAPEVAPAEPVAAAPETQAAEDFYPDLMPAYTAETSVTKQRAIAPVVANIFSQLTGLEGFNSLKVKALPENVQKAYNTTVAAVLNGVKRGEIINPETVAQQKMAEFGVPLPETAAPTMEVPGAIEDVAPEAVAVEAAAPEAVEAKTIETAPQVAPAAPAPAYTYADLVAEADSLVASNPDLVLPGQLTAQQFQQFSIQAEQMPALAQQGVEVPSPVELRQDLYKLAGREAPPLATPAAPEPAAAEEYDAEAFSAATTQAPGIWAKFSKQVKGKAPPAWTDLSEEAQDNFVGAIAAAPVDIKPVELAKIIRPTFEAIRTGKPIPVTPAPVEAAPTPAAPVEAAPTPVAPEVAAPEVAAPTPEAVAPVEAAFTPVAPEVVAPEVVAPEVVAPEPAPAPIGFKTAMGSTYTLDAEGRTTREKAKRDTPGHEGDFGPKATSAKTVYVDSAEQAAALSAAGLQGLTSKGARVAIKDGKATLLTWNPKEKRWGTTPSSRDISVYSEPAVGRAPLELWKPAKDVPGFEAYSNMHAGNPITELVMPTAPTPAPQVVLEAETPATAGAPPAAPPGAPPIPPVPPSGAAPQPGPKPKKPRVIKINKAKMQWAMREAGLLERRDNAFRKKLIRSKTTHELSDSAGEMFFGSRAYQGPMNLLRALRDSLTPQAKRAMLPFLPTDDITRWVGDRLKNVAVINKLIDDMTVYRNKRLEKTSVIQNKWVSFTAAFPKGADTLNALTKLADFHDVDPTLAATPEEYAKSDPEMKRLIKEKASKAKRDNRQDAIDEVYTAKRQLTQRENGSGAGLEIFKLAKDAYRRNLIDSYILTLNRITGAGLSAEAEKIAVSRIKFMYKEALARRVYFPTMRYGRFWMSVGKGKNVEYYMFETAFERDMAFAQRNRDMEAENDLRDMDKGNDYAEVTNYLTKGNDASAALKEVFEQLDSGSLENTAQLKDAVFQMYLLALPEGDMRKRFSHRRYVTGFGMDALRDFSNSQSRAASQLARLSYAHQIRNAKTQLEGEIKGKPDRVAMEPFVSEISMRADAEIDPPVRGGFYGLLDKFAGLGNKFVFLWMLTSPKSALIQATQLHTVGLPVLSDEFGFRKVMDIAGRYSMDIILGNKLAIHRKDNNGDIISEFSVNMRDAKFMQDLAKTDPQKHKLLLEAYDYADQRGTFASTFISDLNETASRSTKVGTVKSALKEGDVLSAAKQGGDAMMQFMSAGFHQMENMNRQIMYMTSFELAYEQAKKSGMSDTAAKEKAMERALKVTRETMFNYSNYNKPRAFKNPAGRIAFQFMTYPVMMTSYLVRNAKGILPGLNAEGKMSAVKRLFGTLGMTAMYAGMTGLPLYGVFMMAAEAAREMLRDDDDFAPYEDDKGNPLGKVSLKYWFENSWLPETFGPGSSVAKTLGLPPELAALLERSVKFGPISALSDMNLASSTSLNDLFFRGDVKADNLEGQFKEILYNQMLGPLGGLISNMTRGVQLYEEGETTRAMELILPAFVKGAVRASRLSDEGLRTIDGKTVMEADFYTEGKLFNQVLGFGSTEAYEKQKQNFEGKQLIDDIKAEREGILQKVKSAELRAIENPTETNLRAMARANDAMEKFNSRYPFSPIGGQNIGAAVSNALEEQAGSIGGASPDAEYPVMSDVLARRIEREQ